MKRYFEYKCTILGSSSSRGVPEINCKCFVCRLSKKKNKRTRSSILISCKEGNLLIDTSPDFKEQAIREKILKIDGIIYTHLHYDHVAGIGDAQHLVKKNTPIFIDKLNGDKIQKLYPYFFSKSDNSLFNCINYDEKDYGNHFNFLGMKIIPFKQIHGSEYSYGFRFGKFAYATDVNYLDKYAYKVLAGVKILIVDCLNYYNSKSHFSLDETIECILKINPMLAILTHMSHNIDYYEILKFLPHNIKPAFDGMKIKF